MNPFKKIFLFSYHRSPYGPARKVSCQCTEVCRPQAKSWSPPQWKSAAYRLCHNKQTCLQFGIHWLFGFKSVLSYDRGSICSSVVVALDMMIIVLTCTTKTWDSVYRPRLISSLSRPIFTNWYRCYRCKTEILNILLTNNIVVTVTFAFLLLPGISAQLFKTSLTQSKWFEPRRPVISTWNMIVGWLQSWIGLFWQWLKFRQLVKKSSVKP